MLRFPKTPRALADGLIRRFSMLGERGRDPALRGVL
jgi:hypothetical protein